MEGYSDIPRLYTALAEWLFCIAYISLQKTRWEKKATIGISAAALAGFVIFFRITGNAPIYLWIPFMFLAVGMMYGYLFLAMKITPIATAYCCAKAFLAAEFAASLEWQIESYLIRYPIFQGMIVRSLLLIFIYATVFFGIWKLEKPMQSEEYLHQISIKEAGSAMATAIFAFLFSNMSFVITSSPFSGRSETDIFNIRTLVDLCGLLILYAFQSRICEYMVEKELASIQSMYKKQYDQYRYYQNSMEMIHIKYHDLKHQITGLRSETDAEKRKEWLDQLERELDENRLIDRTGNQVLDTILGAKIFQAQKNKIRITCVADGKLLNFMHVMDICTIFGNALDNAVESVVTLEDPEKRMIHVAVSSQKNFVLINVSNYFEEPICWENGKLPKTSKADKKNHGFGLKSIRYTVDKYGGSMSVNAKKNWFELRILIPDRN